MATPRAEPICKAVLLRPEASPDSSLATPASAATVAVTKASPIPTPHRSSPEEDIREVAAAYGDLGKQERPRGHERHTSCGDGAETDLGRDREDHRADAELEGRVAEYLLRVERKDEWHADPHNADKYRHGVRAGEGSRAKEVERQERRLVARLDQREGGDEQSRAEERADRPYVRPADGRRLDDGVDEQNERTGDSERPRGVVAPPRQRDPALAQHQRRQHKPGHADRNVDKEDPPPARAVNEWAADEPRRGGADAAECAPEPERLVPLGAFSEGGGDDRESGYLRTPTGISHGAGLYVLTLAGDQICAMARFDNSVLPWFGLPRSLPSP